MNLQACVKGNDFTVQSEKCSLCERLVLASACSRCVQLRWQAGPRRDTQDSHWEWFLAFFYTITFRMFYLIVFWRVMVIHCLIQILHIVTCFLLIQSVLENKMENQESFEKWKRLSWDFGKINLDANLFGTKEKYITTQMWRGGKNFSPESKALLNILEESQWNVAFFYFDLGIFNILLICVLPF